MEYLSGQRIGNLEFISNANPITNGGKKRKAINVRCFCGVEFIVRVDHVKYGVATSCGCLRKQRAHEATFIKHEIGEIINGFVYLGDVHNNKKLRECNFKCKVCNKEFISRLASIKSNHTKSCGCYKINALVGRVTHHGMANTSEYRSWQHMIGRCLNKRNTSYQDYGGRGIKVCKRWLHSFENFMEDMGRKPTPKHTIERIDNNGNYSKRNCKWATKKEQNSNRRNTKYLTIDGVKKPLIKWIEESGLQDKTVRDRIKKGVSLDQILSKTHLKYKHITLL